MVDSQAEVFFKSLKSGQNYYIISVIQQIKSFIHNFISLCAIKSHSDLYQSPVGTKFVVMSLPDFNDELYVLIYYMYMLKS